MIKRLLEIAAFSIESALIADKAGADRIELCSDLSSGGVTPSIEGIKEAKAKLSCPFFVMVRPRGGDFFYSDAEIGAMKQQLLEAKALGVDGFVFGVLDKDGLIDVAINKNLVNLAHPLPCTFHRAFDAIEDKQAALETLISCGFQRLLTSGGVGNAIDYCKELNALIKQADGRIVVMPGGGVRGINIDQLRNETAASEYHSAAIINGGAITNAAEIKEIMRRLDL